MELQPVRRTGPRQPADCWFSPGQDDYYIDDSGDDDEDEAPPPAERQQMQQHQATLPHTHPLASSLVPVDRSIEDLIEDELAADAQHLARETALAREIMADCAELLVAQEGVCIVCPSHLCGVLVWSGRRSHIGMCVQWPSIWQCRQVPPTPTFVADRFASPPSVPSCVSPSVPHSLTHSLTHSFTHSPIHLLTHKTLCAYHR